MIFNSIQAWEQVPLPQAEKVSRITVKAFSPNDKAGLQRILDFDEMAYFTQNDTPKDHEPTRYSLKELKNMFQHGEIYGIYGLRQGSTQEEMIGFYIFERKPQEPNALYIGGLDIHPELRDIGLGSWILQVAEATARQTEGIDKLTLTVDPLNGRGLNAYLKHGFRVTKFKPDYFGPKMDRFWMEKPLTEEPNKYVQKNQTNMYKRTVACGNTEGLLSAVKDGLVGVCLERGQNNYQNKVIFMKPSSQ